MVHKHPVSQGGHCMGPVTWVDRWKFPPARRRATRTLKGWAKVWSQNSDNDTPNGTLVKLSGFRPNPLQVHSEAVIRSCVPSGTSGTAFAAEMDCLTIPDAAFLGRLTRSWIVDLTRCADQVRLRHREKGPRAVPRCLGIRLASTRSPCFISGLTSPAHFETMSDR
jgi:hypothetical protein